VLVVEDNEVVAQAVAEGLRDQGMAVDMADDGAAGLEKAELNTYDVFSELRDNAPAQRPVWPWRRNARTAGNWSRQVDEDVTEARALPKADIRC